MGEGFSGWYTIPAYKDGTPVSGDLVWACPVPGRPSHERVWTDASSPPCPGFPTREDAGAFGRYVGATERYERHVTADELRALVSMWRAQREVER